MSLLELGGKQFTIPVGEVALGSDANCAIPLSGAGVLPRHVVLERQPDGQVVIRKATPEAEVLVNGVRLGVEPTPLLHGDKLEVGGYELTFVDERRAGTTQFVEKVELPEPTAAPQGRAAPERAATRNTGGRVVSLTDGREYVMSGASLVFGREAGCDVVVPETDVSRRHAEIVQTAQGYLLVDSSTNGTFVNEERVRGQRILRRADVIRIGGQGFRFYADAVPAAAPPAPQAGPAAGTPLAAQAPPGAAERLQLTMDGLETLQRPARGGPLASFLVRVGELRGRRLPVKTPIVNIGRADYNDLVFPDPSVSTAHAKLQLRGGVWLLVDLDSTNGTFVDGERVKDEAPLAPGATVRLGDVQLAFEPTDDAVPVIEGSGTRVSAAFPEPPPPAPTKPEVRIERPLGAPARRASEVQPPGGKTSRRRVPPPPQKKTTGCGASAALIILLGAGFVAIVQRLLA